MASKRKKGPIKLNNLLAKGKKRFGDVDSNDDGFDFLAERESLVATNKNAPPKPPPFATKPKKEVQRPEPEATKEKAALKIEAKRAKNQDLKQVTNTQQIGNKTHNLAPEIDNKPTTNTKQNDNQIGIQSGNNLKTDNKTNTPTNNVAKLENFDPDRDYRTLVGNEKLLFSFIYHEALREGGLETGRLPISALVEGIKASLGVTRTTLHRLKQKGLLEVVECRKGRAGWSRYGISKSVYQKLQNDDVFFNSGPKWVTKQVTENTTMAPSSSSISFSNNLKNITTTTSGAKKVTVLPIDWADVVIPQTMKDHRFGKPHLIQILNQGVLTAEDVQDSLDHFTHDLENGHVVPHTGAVNMLMGILKKKGIPYISEKYVKALRAERDEMLKLKEEYAEIKRKKEKESQSKEFESFWSNLSEAERDAYMEPNQVAPSGSEYQKVLAKSKFVESLG
ncbi:MAG: hypothetical protein CL677_00345 [Bdellovibrionaceae bacterium]|jgi:hypothetical protein|nr:hypothetical protein [Pseudobdellovibrionaceae bacterium]|tara:strand:+ start:9051 stop:10400 length:1350 start_codon:yes stop_codon:yes gene_type:complete